MSKNKKAKKWTAKLEKEQLLSEMVKSRDKIESLKTQKAILYDSLTTVIVDEDLTKEVAAKKIGYLRTQIADLDSQISDEVTMYNNYVERYGSLEEAEGSRKHIFWTAVEVIGGAVLGVGGLALSHRDTIAGRIKNREEDNFFQTAWKKLFR